ncbi:hypothetical protein CTI14_66490, partial [Methylobacterium radiotolerans]
RDDEAAVAGIDRHPDGDVAASVNFSAFDTKLLSTCPRRTGSQDRGAEPPARPRDDEAAVAGIDRHPDGDVAASVNFSAFDTKLL